MSSKSFKNAHLFVVYNSFSQEEDMDPEMREYRKKMEEQKRLREKILQEKENRRKQAAMEKMGDESRVDSRNGNSQCGFCTYLYILNKILYSNN